MDRLERRSLANYFYQVVGKLDEKLTKEKQDGYSMFCTYDYRSDIEDADYEFCWSVLESGDIRRVRM